VFLGASSHGSRKSQPQKVLSPDAIISNKPQTSVKEVADQKRKSLPATLSTTFLGNNFQIAV